MTNEMIKGDIMKAYKVFNNDWTCRGFKYEIGKTYELEGNLEVCKNGFHACEKLVDCFNYYTFDSNNKVAEVEILGDIVKDNDKIATNKIKIVKELTWYQVLDKVNIGNNNTGNRNSGNRNSGNNNTGNRNSGNRNSGYNNSGDCNSGHWNSGNRNSGYINSGDRNSGNCNSGYNNSGHWNSGHWNSCNNETGVFNSYESDEIRVFNKPCKKDIWDKSPKPELIYNIELTIWDEDKQKLKQIEYKQAWLNAWNKAKEKRNWRKEYNLLINLPNFDKKVFLEITGIDVEKMK